MVWLKSLGLIALAGLVLSVLAPPALGGDTATVTGKISYNGKPLKSGKVTFHPAAGKAIVAKLNADGTYEAKNVPVGELKVTVQSKALPKKYANVNTSGLVYQPQKGENAFDIELK